MAPAVLAALVVGASTAAVTTVFGAPPAGVPVELSARGIVIPAPGSGVQPDFRPLEPSTTPPPTETAAPSTRAEQPKPPPSVLEQVLSLVNQQRAGAGCAPVAADARLARAAQGHSDDMAARAYFSHTSQDGRSFAARITAAGHPSPAAENIAKGQRTAADVMRAWMDSPGHRANILNCDHRGMGVGHTAAGYYWVQNFSR